jgi:ATP-binding cassette subfamily C protein LapB
MSSPFNIKDLFAEFVAIGGVAKRAMTLSRQLGAEHAASKGGRDAATAEPVDTVTGAPLVSILMDLLGRAGQEASVQGLTAALPMAEDDLDPRVAPMALARFHVQAHWERRRLLDLAEPDYPCVLRLREGGFILALGLSGDGCMRVAQIAAHERGTELVTLEALALTYAGDALLVGAIDPINGDTEADERDSMRAKPKQWILARFFEDRRLLIQLLLATALLNVVSLAMPLYQRAIYDRVVPNVAIESLWAVTIGMTIALIFEFMLKNVRADFIEATGLRVSHLVQHKVMAGLMSAKREAAPTSTGAVLVALRDVDGLAHLAPLAIATFFVDLPFFAVNLFLLWMIGGPIVLSAVLGACAIALCGMIAASGLGRMGEHSSKLSRARSNQVVDAVEGLQTLKSNQAEGRFLRDWSIISDHMAMSGHAQRQWSEWANGVTAFSVQSVTLLVLIIGIYQMKEGNMTTGALIACSLLAGRAMQPIATATGILARAHQALSQFAALASFIALPPEKDLASSSISGRKLKGSIEFRRVSFHYEKDAPPVLSEISVRIAPGERVALIGKSGSGKSTFLQLAAGLAEPTQGKLLFDDFPGEHYGVSQLRAAISFASQEALIFDTPLKDNILLGAPKASEEDIAAALQISGVDQIAMQLPEGYGTKLGHRGTRLSTGQRQCVILARALARRASILLLDEPTSALDAASEARVRDGLSKLPRDRTIILTTHRLELLSLVDRVIWLEGGKVVADAPTQEVMSRLRSVGAVRPTGPGQTAPGQSAAGSTAVTGT